MTNRLSRYPSFEEVFKWASDTRQAGYFFALPGMITKYDAAKQIADVKPLLKHNMLTSNGGQLVESVPLIYNVPVIFQRGGGHFISFPLAKGDKVLLVFCDRNHDQYMRQPLKGSEVSDEGVDPLDMEFGGLNGAVAIPGFYPDVQALDAADASTEDLVIGKQNGTQVHIKPNGQIHLGSNNSADFVALATLVNNRIAALENAFNTFVNTMYNTHVHPHPFGPTTQTASQGIPVTPGSSTAASKVKAD